MRGLSTLFLSLALAVTALNPAQGRAETVIPPVHHDMQVLLDPDNRSLTVRDKVRINGGGLVLFRLAPGFEVMTLSVDGAALEPERTDKGYRVDLGGQGEHEVFFHYRGKLAEMSERPGSKGLSPAAAGPQGSFLTPSSAWYPQAGERAVTYRIEVEVPDPQKAVVPGRLLEETLKGGIYRAVFAMDRRSQGIVMMAGPFVVAEKTSRAIRLRTYFHPEISALSGEYLELTAGYIERYQKLIGDYPFSSFFIVSGPLGVGFGYPGLTYMGTRVLRLPFIRYGSLGHEVLHNWWGNGVFIDYRTGNWAEGLTTFMADYALAGERDPSAAMGMRLNWLRNYAALPQDRDRAVVDFAARSHDASQIVGYNKVAFFFHMLRNEVGSKTFDAAVRRFWGERSFKVSGWDHLRRAFEAASGRNLKEFFSQWLTRKGAPRIGIGEASANITNGRHGISLTLLQDQPPYSLKIPIKVTTKDGERRRIIAIDAIKSRHRIFTGSKPLAMEVDPGFDIFRRLDPTEAPPIMRDVTLSGQTLTIIMGDSETTDKAARALAQRLLDRPPRYLADGAPEPPATAPLLVIGTGGKVQALLSGLGLAGVPKSISGRGTARAWAARDKNGRALFIVAGAGAEAIEALSRPLAHYGGKGFLVFEGSRAIEKGTWPPAGGPLNRRFE
ncbi:MAG: M1 family aminopeptidase [Rhodospirillales bacterium]